MKTRIDSLAVRAAALSAAAVALSVPAVSAHAVTAPATHGAAVTTHSPQGSCAEAALLGANDRQLLVTTPHMADAIGIVVTHRHAPCPAFVDYLKQMSA